MRSRDGLRQNRPAPLHGIFRAAGNLTQASAFLQGQPAEGSDRPPAYMEQRFLSCSTGSLFAVLITFWCGQTLAADRVPGQQVMGVTNSTAPVAATPGVSKSIRVGDSTISGSFVLHPTTGAITGPVDIQWDNGDRFIGNLVDGKRNGRGKFSWKSGQVYDGDWRDDRQEGLANILFPNGDRYEGEVTNGLPNGKGVRITKNGDRYEGRFSAGQPDIEGSSRDANGDRYVGQWKAGVRHGKGKFEWANGLIYDGQWQEGMPQGRGVFISANGDRYEGEVRNGQPHGQGSRAFASSGDRYEGQFEFGQAHGQGTYTWKSGDVYKGLWQGGKKVGMGRYTWANGDYWEGEFENDRQSENGKLYFTPTLSASTVAVEQLAKQTNAAAETAAAQPPTPARPIAPGTTTPQAASNPPEISKLLAIPMISKEVRECQRQNLSDCASRVSREIMDDRLFRHKWQLMSSDKDAKGREVNFEVDANSELAEGNVFSWLRTGDASNARKIGIKYDCRGQALTIQLIYNCSGAELKACTLDPNIDKYVGRVIPATDIRKWFVSACERS
ncbi:hypothetical protein [Viridibacterium curvum]|uniref:MORN repeat protein n=1 Tax=Viridibacterium curvum TaxID=1101404 RepID=A0ABP9QVT7_9RHOO